MSMRPVTDKAEVSIDFPDKAYMGAFGRDSKFDAHADDQGVMLKLSRPGEDKRVVELHLHHYLFADVLRALAESIRERPPIDDEHRGHIVDAAKALHAALLPRKRR